MSEAERTAGRAPASSALRQHVRQTVRLAVPVMLARCGFIIMVTVDTVMTGQVSAEMLAHYGIAMAPHLTVLVIGIGLMAATTILSAQFAGAGREGEIGSIWRNALVIALGLLVDDAMIVIEMMHVRLEQGWERIKAATFAYQVTAFPMLSTQRSSSSFRA